MSSRAAETQRSTPFLRARCDRVAQNEMSFSIFLDTGFRRLHRISFVARTFAHSTTN
jgi:hypothetical protein